MSSAAASENLFDGFAADIYRAHVSVEHRRFARTGVDSAARDNDLEDSESEGSGRAPYTRSDTRPSWDSPSADLPPHSRRSSSSALPVTAGLHGASRKTKTRPADTDGPNISSNPARATRRPTMGSDSDDSDPEMAALFAAESTAASHPVAASQGPGKTLGLLDMAAEDYQPSQRRGDGATQYGSHTQHRHREVISPAVSAPRPAGGSLYQPSSPAGSSNKKIKKKKRNRKVI